MFFYAKANVFTIIAFSDKTKVHTVFFASIWYSAVINVHDAYPVP